MDYGDPYRYDDDEDQKSDSGSESDDRSRSPSPAPKPPKKKVRKPKEPEPKPKPSRKQPSVKHSRSSPPKKQYKPRMKGHCNSCKAVVSVRNGERVQMASGAYRIIGTCRQCGKKINTFPKVK